MVQLGGFQLDEGVAGRVRGEVDDRTGAEEVVALGEVEGDVVTVDVDELEPGLRLVALQCGHDVMLP